MTIAASAFAPAGLFAVVVLDAVALGVVGFARAVVFVAAAPVSASASAAVIGGASSEAVVPDEAPPSDAAFDPVSLDAAALGPARFAEAGLDADDLAADAFEAAVLDAAALDAAVLDAAVLAAAGLCGVDDPCSPSDVPGAAVVFDDAAPFPVALDAVERDPVRLLAGFDVDGSASAPDSGGFDAAAFGVVRFDAVVLEPAARDAPVFEAVAFAVAGLGAGRFAVPPSAASVASGFDVFFGATGVLELPDSASAASSGDGLLAPASAISISAVSSGSSAEAGMEFTS